jgi:hypothetical protein
MWQWKEVVATQSSTLCIIKTTTQGGSDKYDNNKK